MPMSESHSLPLGRVVGTLALFALLGIPLVAYIWETLNRLMGGYFDATRVLLTIPAIAALLGVLMWLAHTLQRWELKRAH